MWPYAWNTLDEAASWLSNELGNIALTARQVLELGVRGKAALHVVVPEGSIPQPSGGRFGLLKDHYEGFVRLSSNDCHVLAGRGSVRFSSVDHPSDPNKSIKLNHSVELNLSMLRISGDELRKIASEVRSRAKKRAVARAGTEQRVLIQPEARQGLMGAEPVHAAAASVTAAAPLGRQRHQENEMLRVLADLGYDPKQLPRPPAGSAGPKSEARAKLPEMTRKVFDNAWERLRKFGDIADAE